ncbi:MAG: PilW family protein [Zoogloeaceae bacterium]|jgi:type II secretory pathway pseudopilin PulG|nr:PilW family protein [Zoogloeaceae bacterium]
MNSIKKYGQGFSLVEMMVAMVIGFLIVGGMLSVYLSNSSSFRFNSQMARIQENGRFAMNLLEDDIRMSAYAGCTKTSLTEGDEVVETITVDSIPSGITEDDVRRGVHWNGSTTLTVYSVPARIKTDGTPEDARDAWANGDCAGSTQIGLTEGTGLIHAPIVSKVEYTFEPPDYTAGKSGVLKVTRGDTAQEELLENVDHFQVCLGMGDQTAGNEGQLDLNPDGTWKVPGSDDDRKRVTAVQVDLILASGATDDVLSENVAPSFTLCDSTSASPRTWPTSFPAVGTVNDKKLHKLFHSTVTLRNKVPNGYGSDESYRYKDTDTTTTP